MKEQFKTVYYIVQVVPKLKVCGFSFDKRKADKLALLVQKYTGHKGRIIKFSRAELTKLNFTRK